MLGKIFTIIGVATVAVNALELDIKQELGVF